MPKPTSRQLRKLKNNVSLLIKMGYRRVSNSSCTVARVDKPDWQKDIFEINPAILLSDDGGADHYRRAISEDKIKLEDAVYKMIPGSNHDPVGFIDEDGNDVRSKVVLLAPDEVVIKAENSTVAALPPTKPSFIGWLLSFIR